MDYEHICMASKIAHHDLLVAHSQLEKGVVDASLRLLFLRHIFSEVANIRDLSGKSRSLYRDHPDLAASYKKYEAEIDFFSYLRDKYTGHYVPELSQKTLEWIPEAYRFLCSGQLRHEFAISLFSLETAINTYVDGDGHHKLFSSDTDLNFPSDNERFMDCLHSAVSGCLLYVTQLSQVAYTYIDLPSSEMDLTNLWVDSGSTDFARLRKGKR